eukprot:CAMPEP_0176121800 /NCGR_PEP_ID=MMETSP0120_2-20121206/61321_1 /TAXON_ID=160619 /ORGANISM="Kryptoperidinium foliaceum, Strain CCMP 1326" /LENGTH=30 /DNA_ID= /DNA_START= /DNA_END= /DNA_ORIENTATION=
MASPCSQRKHAPPLRQNSRRAACWLQGGLR